MRKPFHQNFSLTQGFGENPASYARFGMKGHNGLDYGLPSGTDVVAPHSGEVIEVASDPTGYGLYIKIENDKEGSVLAHLKDNLVSIGSTVSEGQLIAHSNNTGNSTGPHLHWGYYRFPRDRQNGYAGFINQLPLIQEGSTPSNQAVIDQLRNDRDKYNKDLIEICVKLGVNQDDVNRMTFVHQRLDELLKHKCPDVSAKDQRIKELGDLSLKLQDKINRIKKIADE